MDLLLRDQAPLTPEQWLALDETVVQTARRALVCRRFIPIFGPLGPGTQAVPDDRLSGGAGGAVDLMGNAESASVRLSVRRYLPVPLIYKDFRLPWRDLEAAAQTGAPLDMGGADAAAAACAHAEDDLIVNGNLLLGLPGLRAVDGAQQRPLGDWNDPEQALNAVVAATEALFSAGFYGAATVLTSPLLFSRLNRMYGNSGLLTVEQVQKLVRGGVYQSPVVPEQTALVLSAESATMDLALAQDMIVAYQGPENLNHLFRVLEMLVLRIKQPRAIVVLAG
ncbi:MAG TPA: family 1 encapsulin nanocompartment shell protein [Dehalococcoidia bacterium]|nr:family 1 encapsulin nanocompartment shell protein [Dehalococcoidia bacterium]